MGSTFITISVSMVVVGLVAAVCCAVASVVFDKYNRTVSNLFEIACLVYVTGVLMALGYAMLFVAGLIR